MQAGAWTWLEIAKLLAALSVPLAVLLLGFRLEGRKVANQELTKKRIAVFDVVAPRLNDILCFYRAIGHWSSLDPDKIIQCKRECDRQMHVYQALFSSGLFRVYQDFMKLCFETFSSAQGGMPAKLRLDLDHLRREMGHGWSGEWQGRVSNKATSIDAMVAGYETLMAAFAVEIGVDS